MIKIIRSTFDFSTRGITFILHVRESGVDTTAHVNHYTRRLVMLATTKIAGAFAAICEEAEKLENKDLPRKIRKRLRSIISIAKHQSDVRCARKGSCKAHKKSCSH